MTEWSRARRLARLRNDTGRYVLAAADHGLTFGPIDGLHSVTDITSLALNSGITGMVVNYGAIPVIPTTASIGVVLQTYAGFAGPGPRTSKVRIIDPHEAATLGVDAIAVELSLDQTTALPSVSNTILQAHQVGLPVMIMATPIEGSDLLNGLLHATRIATELGADLVKIGLANTSSAISKEAIAHAREQLSSTPPLLLAGGPRTTDISTQVQLAVALGFQGVCIGRHMFGHGNPSQFIGDIADAFGSNHE